MAKPKAFDIDNARLIQLLTNPPKPKRYRLWIPLALLLATVYLAHLVRG